MPIKKETLTQKEICKQWMKNKNINPETLRAIKETGAIYKKLDKNCSSDKKDKPLNKNKNEKKVKLTESAICNLWRLNKNINPITSRAITTSGKIYKELAKKCSHISSSSIKPSSSSSSSIKPSSIKPSSSSSSSIKPGSQSRTKKINAIKKIHKLFIPYIKRVSVNIIDRINYFLIIKNHILSIKDTNNCLTLYNFDEKTNKPIYRIGKNIVLDKQIGTDSTYGIVFLSHFKSNIKYGTKFDRINKFAVKITDQMEENKFELLVLKELTKQVIGLRCPHFPINYGSLKCDSAIKNKISNDYDIVKGKRGNKQYYPKLVTKNKLLYIQLNELAAGDLYSILTSDKNFDIFNTFVQLILSIMFFHKCINAHHSDTHEGNFLYHKVKPGGYFHYNIYGQDYYLENKGYLWVIWDFGSYTPFKNSKEVNNFKFGEVYTQKPMINDYLIISQRLDKYQDYLSSEFMNINKLFINDILIKKYKWEYDVKKSTTIDIEILEYLVKNVSSFTTTKPSNIINKSPYIIK
jgi:hypothetical protein